MEQKEYDVFISYSRSDYMDDNNKVIPNNEISKILKRLDDEHIHYWFDVGSNYKSKEWPEILVNSIESSKVFVYLATEEANMSEMTSNEIAIACEFRKPIIPVRIDFSPYNKTVMFRIANIDYIEYYKNPEKGMADLIRSVKHCLSDIQAETDRKQREEEERKIKEKKEKEETEERIRKEQQQLIDEIKKGCIVLNSEEGKLEIDRKSLLQKTELIVDEVKRAEISEHIKKSSPIYEKARNDFEQNMINSNTSSPIIKKLHWIYGSVLASLIIFGIVTAVVSYNNISKWKRELDKIPTISADSCVKVNNIELETPVLGKYIYSGTVDSLNMPDGEGMAVFPNGDVYKGTFVHGDFKEGRYTFVKDSTFFEGTFKDNLPDKSKGAYYFKKQ